jgi:hypothetical protein
MWIRVPNSLTYQEIIILIEKLMTDSGIREYCTKICEGSCCAGCYTSEGACRHHEGRRLICSAFICRDLKNLFCKKTNEALCDIHDLIERQYTRYKDITQTYGSSYFNSPDKIFLEIVRFPTYLKKEIETVDIEEIKNITSKLIKNKRKIR